ncbi:MAG: Holliday junction resolvase [Euryarchaeota archaeon]|nr:Holliday junction resolvase [Euryarchaeota archaeon]
MSQLYERELKGILMAEREVLIRITQHLPQEESIPYMDIMKRPFVVVRAAGSFGIDMAVVGSISFLVEEKTSSARVYHFNSARIKEQAEQLKDLCTKAGITPVYAYRLKNLRGKDPWRLFTMDMDNSNLSGYQKDLHGRLLRYKLETTKDNNYIMRWENGWPLHQFIKWYTHLKFDDWKGGD